MEKKYVLTFRWIEEDERLSERVAVSSSKEELIGKVYELFREEMDENADNYGSWEDDKSVFYCFLDEGLESARFTIEEL